VKGSIVMKSVIATASTSCYLTIKNVFSDVVIAMPELEQIVIRSKPSKITLDIIGINPNDGEYITLDNITLPRNEMMNYISRIYYPYKQERGNVSFINVTIEMLEITDEITDSNFDNNRMESVCLD
jgi:hypothetical protein